MVTPASAQERPVAASDAAVGDRASRIARLVEVWGFVKYHHPDALDGSMAMDPAFFELYPQVAGAKSMAEADTMLLRWLVRIGIGEACDPCGGDTLPEAGEIALIQPTNAWTATLPEALALRVRAIYENRGAAPANFQVETMRGVGNPKFLNEADYSATGREDPAIRMLALAKMWNTLRYWFPYRDVMDEAPEAILAPAIADVLAAETPEDHQRALARLSAKAVDGHARVMAFDAATTPKGDCRVPYSWRFAEGRLVVDVVQAHPASSLKRGDIVTAIGGQSLAALDAKYSPTIAASNDPYRKRALASLLARGECGPRTVMVERAGTPVQVTVEWLPEKEAGINLFAPGGRAGETIQQWDDGITYVRYPELKASDLPQLVETANAGKGVILDMRGYVGGFLVFALGGLLTDREVEFARFTKPEPATPGLFTWTKPITIKPDPSGKRIDVPVITIIDERAVSSAEYHAMAWRAAGVTLVGSATAGADGNVSTMQLPLDSAQMRFSGIGVFYPDQSPTQRIGIVPDIEVIPTIAGIAAGRDEMLERAVRELEQANDEEP